MEKRSKKSKEEDKGQRHIYRTGAKRGFWRQLCRQNERLGMVQEATKKIGADWMQRAKETIRLAI